MTLPRPARAADPIEVPPVEVETDPAARASPGPAPVHRVADPDSLDAPSGVASALARMPSVRVREAGGTGQAASASVRGVDPSGTLATLDGVPLNSPFLGGADLAGLALLPLADLELHPGGRSATAGTDAVGGLLVARTPSPLDGPATELSLGVGSFGTGRLRVSHAALSGRVGVLAAAGLLQSAGDYPYEDRNGRSRVRTHNGATALDGLVKVEAAPRPGHVVSLLVEGFGDDRDIAGLEQFPSDSAVQKDSRLLAVASWQAPRAWGSRGRSSARAWVRRLGLQYGDEAPPMGPPVSSALVSWGGGVEASSEGTVWRDLSVSAGLSAATDRGTVRRRVGGSYDAWRTTTAAFAGLAWSCPGCRLDASATCRVEWDPGHGARLVPRAGVAVDVLPWLRLSANGGRAFRLPTLEELHFDSGYVSGSPDLAPEDAWTWDAGVTLRLPGTATLTATYFENRLDNLILFLPTSAFRVQAVNSGRATVRGVETSLSGRAGPVGASLAYTFLDARFAGGLAMPQRPGHALAGEVTARGGPLTATVRARGQTAFYLDRFESLSEEARVLVDVRVDLSVGDHVTLTAELRNAGDVRTAVDNLQFPLPGRSLWAALKVLL